MDDPTWQTPAMEPGVVLAIAIGIMVVLVWAASRAADGDTRFIWVFVVALLLGSLFVAWAGAAVATFNLPAGITILAVGAIIVVLVGGLMRPTIRRSIVDARSRAAPGPRSDYLVWGVIAAPVVLASLLVVAVIAIRGTGR